MIDLTNEEMKLFFEVVRKGKVNPISHNFNASVEDILVTADMLNYDIDGYLILGEFGSDYLDEFGNSFKELSCTGG